MWSGFQAEKLNTRRELDHAQNEAEPENQAGLVPGPDPDPEENFEIFFLVQDLGQVQVQHGFQAQPGFEHGQVLCGYSNFWPENHFIW